MFLISDIKLLCVLFLTGVSTLLLSAPRVLATMPDYFALSFRFDRVNVCGQKLSCQRQRRGRQGCFVIVVGKRVFVFCGKISWLTSEPWLILVGEVEGRNLNNLRARASLVVSHGKVCRQFIMITFTVEG